MNWHAVSGRGVSKKGKVNAKWLAKLKITLVGKAFGLQRGGRITGKSGGKGGHRTRSEKKSKRQLNRAVVVTWGGSGRKDFGGTRLGVGLGKKTGKHRPFEIANSGVCISRRPSAWGVCPFYRDHFGNTTLNP